MRTRSARHPVRRRSARGGGTRRERRPGVWEIRVSVGSDPATGASMQKSFTHHGDEASARIRQRELVTLYGAQVVPAPPQSARMTVRELLETFLTSPHEWIPTTRRTHTGEGRMICRDRLSRARLDRMTPSTVERAIARWVHAGDTPAVVLARFRVLHSAITWGLRNKLIITDPLDGMHAPAGPHPRQHLQPEQVHQLIATADDAVDKPAPGSPNNQAPGSACSTCSGPSRTPCWPGSPPTLVPAAANSPPSRQLICRAAYSRSAAPPRTASSDRSRTISTAA
jgi:hypothetical protein